MITYSYIYSVYLFLAALYKLVFTLLKDLLFHYHIKKYNTGGSMTQTWVRGF